MVDKMKKILALVIGLLVACPLLALGQGTFTTIVSPTTFSTTVANISTSDPCYGQSKTTSTFYTQTTTQIIVIGVAGKKIFICSGEVLALSSGANFSLIEGNITENNALAVMGSTNTASSYAFGGNGGMTFGSGNGTIAQTVVTSDYLFTLTTSPINVTISYVQQ